MPIEPKFFKKIAAAGAAIFCVEKTIGKLRTLAESASPILHLGRRRPLIPSPSFGWVPGMMGSASIYWLGFWFFKLCQW